MANLVEVLTRAHESLAEGPVKPEVVLREIVKDSAPIATTTIDRSRSRSRRFSRNAIGAGLENLGRTPDHCRTYTPELETNGGMHERIATSTARRLP